MNMINKIYAAIDTDIALPGPATDPTEIHNLQTILNYVNRIINILINAATIVSVIMILYSAFLYVSSFGDESKAETAKKTLIWSFVGLILVNAARWIIDLVRSGIQ